MLSNDDQPLLHMSGIRKAFAGVEVLHGVDFSLRAGEIHALVGENGAGKSTLIKILGGVHTEYDGTIELCDEPRAFTGPRDAEDHGIAIIHQELALIPDLSVAENIFLGREPRTRLGWLDRPTMRRTARQVLHEQLGLDIDVNQRVGSLPLGAQQMIEIAKALSRAARVLVMDEPTSALNESETARLFDIIRQLRTDGVGIVYISHKMEEIYTLADRITVLRDGAYIGTAAADDLPRDRLVQWMVGREVDEFLTPHRATPGDTRLRVDHLWLRDPDADRWLIEDVSLEVRAGEIVGLAGLIGSGTSELLGAIFGRYGPPPHGTVAIDGTQLTRHEPRAAIDAGLALLTNDRKATGLVLPMSILHNLTLATLDECRRGGWISPRLERERSRPFIERMNLRGPALSAEVGTLSGGNQQKVVIARWLQTEPRVLLLDEPTRGIDVAAKADIYALLHELSHAGLAILLITSELPELLALSDRIIVMHRGVITDELTRAAATPERVMHAAMGAAAVSPA